VFIFAAQGITHLLFSSREVPVVLGQAELLNCTPICSYIDLSVHYKIIVPTVNTVLFIFPLSCFHVSLCNSITSDGQQRRESLV
jgi:hypothetical protein